MLNKFILVVAVAFAISAPVAGQVSTPGPSAAEVAQELRMVERKWVDALATRDTKTLSEILDDTYMDTDEQGNQTDKNGLLAALKSGDLVLTAISLSGMKIHSFVYAAVVTGRATQTATYKGQKLAPSVAFTDTFVMINGQWKVVASHRSAAGPAK